jgi:hypothetical protein
MNAKNIAFIFTMMFTSAGYAGDFLNCEASGMEYVAGYSVDLASSLRTDLSDDVEIPTRLKNYKIGISRYDELPRIRLTDTRTGLQTIAIGDYQSYQMVYLIAQISKKEMEENNLFREIIQVRCFKSSFLPPDFKLIK